MSFIKLSCILIDFKNLLLILDQLESIVDRLARINKTFNRFSSESLILASLSNISMSHMQEYNIDVEIDNNIGQCASFLK